MREVEKRILHEERRPTIRQASDLMGPGLGPFSVEVTDWNASETAFNGYFHSLPGALNSPIDGRYWMGTSQATSDGYGVQRVVEFQGDPIRTVVWTRRFSTPVPGSGRVWTAWQLEDGSDTGWKDMINWASGWTVATGTGGPKMWQARQIGNVVYLRGNAKNDTFTGTNVVVCSLDPAITPPSQTSGFQLVGAAIDRWGSVLPNTQIQVTSGTASGGAWFQIVGYYLTD